MNFQSMEYFAAVAKNRSFTRAADALHITQQTLSAHIAGIERSLMSALIRHIPLELTYAGRYFCAMQRNLIQNMTVCFTNLAIF